MEKDLIFELEEIRDLFLGKKDFDNVNFTYLNGEQINLINSTNKIIKTINNNSINNNIEYLFDSELFIFDENNNIEKIENIIKYTKHIFSNDRYETLVKNSLLSIFYIYYSLFLHNIVDNITTTISIELMEKLKNKN